MKGIWVQFRSLVDEFVVFRAITRVEGDDDLGGVIGIVGDFEVVGIDREEFSEALDEDGLRVVTHLGEGDRIGEVRCGCGCRGI